MEQMYESLTRHIPMLENKQYGVTGWYIGGCEYNKAMYQMIYDVYDFVDDVYGYDETGKSKMDYRKILEKAGIGFDEKSISQVDVSMLDGKTVFTLIFTVIRQDRFVTGLILGFCENGCLLKWLKRLKEIDEG